MRRRRNEVVGLKKMCAQVFDEMVKMQAENRAV